MEVLCKWLCMSSKTAMLRLHCGTPYCHQLRSHSSAVAKHALRSHQRVVQYACRDTGFVQWLPPNMGWVKIHWHQFNFASVAVDHCGGHIHDLKQQFGGLVFKWISRDINGVANNITKLADEGSWDLRFFEVPPPGILPLLEHYNLGSLFGSYSYVI
ncbi:hypothetical protein GOBAR_AA30319 [Gossypium barbadense]|uniref:Uncharacterized protein n=1 Tax=Gossypium barbadense TaxID=3634 RepID=A0A2P5WH26_GOSBA|nr:hypothetical protein GOBAR_AA30319 [Gossypium barbadense]